MRASRLPKSGPMSQTTRFNLGISASDVMCVSAGQGKAEGQPLGRARSSSRNHSARPSAPNGCHSVPCFAAMNSAIDESCLSITTTNGYK